MYTQEPPDKEEPASIIDNESSSSSSTDSMQSDSRSDSPQARRPLTMGNTQRSSSSASSPSTRPQYDIPQNNAELAEQQGGLSWLESALHRRYYNTPELKLGSNAKQKVKDIIEQLTITKKYEHKFGKNNPETIKQYVALSKLCKLTFYYYVNRQSDYNRSNKLSRYFKDHLLHEGCTPELEQRVLSIIAKIQEYSERKVKNFQFASLPYLKHDEKDRLISLQKIQDWLKEDASTSSTLDSLLGKVLQNLQYVLNVRTLDLIEDFNTDYTLLSLAVNEALNSLNKRVARYRYSKYFKWFYNLIGEGKLSETEEHAKKVLEELQFICKSALAEKAFIKTDGFEKLELAKQGMSILEKTHLFHISNKDIEKNRWKTRFFSTPTKRYDRWNELQRSNLSTIKYKATTVNNFEIPIFDDPEIADIREVGFRQNEKLVNKGVQYIRLSNNEKEDFFLDPRIASHLEHDYSFRALYHRSGKSSFSLDDMYDELYSQNVEDQKRGLLRLKGLYFRQMLYIANNAGLYPFQLHLYDFVARSNVNIADIVYITQDVQSFINSFWDNPEAGIFSQTDPYDRQFFVLNNYIWAIFCRYTAYKYRTPNAFVSKSKEHESSSSSSSLPLNSSSDREKEKDPNQNYVIVKQNLESVGLHLEGLNQQEQKAYYYYLKARGLLKDDPGLEDRLYH